MSVPIASSAEANPRNARERGIARNQRTGRRRYADAEQRVLEQIGVAMFGGLTDSGRAAVPLSSTDVTNTSMPRVAAVARQRRGPFNTVSHAAPPAKSDDARVKPVRACAVSTFALTPPPRVPLDIPQERGCSLVPCHTRAEDGERQQVGDSPGHARPHGPHDARCHGPLHGTASPYGSANERRRAPVQPGNGHPASASAQKRWVSAEWGVSDNNRRAKFLRSR